MIWFHLAIKLFIYLIDTIDQDYDTENEEERYYQQHIVTYMLHDGKYERN